MAQIYEDKVFNNLDLSDKGIQDVEFTNCKFFGCKFKQSAFRYVIFNECTFEDCQFVSAVFDKTEMKYCSFINSTLIGINWADVSGNVAYSIEKIEKCLLKYNDFENMKLKKLDFGKSEIVFSNFHQVDLYESNFSECNLENTSFSACDMRKSDFRLAQGFHIDTNTCRLWGAKFSHSNLVGLVLDLGIKIE